MKKALSAIISVTGLVYAAASHAIGSLSNNLMALASNVGSLVSGVCFVIGIGLLAGSLIQYRQHRRNRLMTPISKPIFMFILGAVLVCIPLLGHLAPGGEILSHQSAY